MDELLSMILGAVMHEIEEEIAERMQHQAEIADKIAEGYQQQVAVSGIIVLTHGGDHDTLH
jgi:hypothetical protein